MRSGGYLFAGVDEGMGGEGDENVVVILLLGFFVVVVLALNLWGFVVGAFGIGVWSCLTVYSYGCGGCGGLVCIIERR